MYSIKRRSWKHNFQSTRRSNERLIRSEESGVYRRLHSNPVLNTDTEGAIESVRVNGVFVLSGLNFK